MKIRSENLDLLPFMNTDNADKFLFNPFQDSEDRNLKLSKFINRNKKRKTTFLKTFFNVFKILQKFCFFKI